MTSKRDYYDILGTSKTASIDEIKKAYRKLALQYHPDRNKEKDAESKFKEITEAYEILSNPQKRSTYDQFGHAAFDPSAGGPFNRAGSAGSPFGGTYYTSGNPGDFADFFGGSGDPFDIFETFFGGSSRRGPQKPHYSLKITFEEAALGTTKKLVHQGKEHTIKVPAGADDGTRIRYTDFDVSFDVKPHEYFKREGYDLFIDVQIPFTLAALGGDISVPTLKEKDLKIKIRPGTQPNSMIRLSGKGLKHLQSDRKGDLYIRLHVSIPQKLTSKQKDLLKQLAKTL